MGVQTTRECIALSYGANNNARSVQGQAGRHSPASALVNSAGVLACVDRRWPPSQTTDGYAKRCWPDDALYSRTHGPGSGRTCLGQRSRRRSTRWWMCNRIVLSTVAACVLYKRRSLPRTVIFPLFFKYYDGVYSYRCVYGVRISVNGVKLNILTLHISQ